MDKITKVKTGNREEWLALRHKYIGGSDAAAVVGLNAFSSPYELWAEKTGRIPAFGGNLTTEVGAYLEDFVAKKFAEETGKKVKKSNQSFLNSRYPWAIGNIDREIVGENAGLEIKTTSELNLKKFKDGEYPANYYVQCIHYLAVTGKERWYLAVLIGNKELKIFTIERDEGEINALMGAESEFWEHVRNDTAPAVDGSKSTTETITAIYTDSSNDNSVDLFGYAADLERYIELGKQIKALEEMQAEAANKVKAYMGNSESGECDRFRVSWKSCIRNTFDRKRFEKDNPDRDLSEYFNQSSYRTFKINEIKGVH